MLITMQLPRAAAEKMRIPVEADSDEVEVTLPAVEWAGRMTLATGRAISPGALEMYATTPRAGQLPTDATEQADRDGPELQVRTKRSPRSASQAVTGSAVVEWVSGVLIECYL